MIGALDALVLIGGGDLDPAVYEQQAHAAVRGVDPVRDGSEMALLGAALALDLPVPAICRGHQLLNVHLGGTLHQHLPEVVGHDGHQPGPGAFDDVEVVTAAGSRTADIIGAKEIVRCCHHQALDRLGQGLVVSARSMEPAGGPPADLLEGVVEAIELPDRRFVIGVQWHPEESGDQRLFDALVVAAAR